MNRQPSAQGKVLVCFAVKEEAVFFRPFAKSTLGVEVVVTGMGKANTQRELAATLARLDRLPYAVITSGFAGGLSASARPGDVFVESDAPVLANAFESAGAKPGRFHCSARVASTAAEKQALAVSTGADAVEMESGFIRHSCRLAGVPCATVRVILDPVEQDLPLDFNALLDERSSLAPGKLAAALLKKPVAIRGLMRLRRQTRVAAQRLAQVLEAGIARVLTRT